MKHVRQSERTSRPEQPVEVQMATDAQIDQGRGAFRNAVNASPPLATGTAPPFSEASVVRPSHGHDADVASLKQPFEKAFRANPRHPATNVDLPFNAEEMSSAVVLDAIPLPVFFKNRDGIHLGCNRAFESFSGRSKGDIIGKTVFDLVPAPIAETYAALDEALFANGGVQQYEAKATTENGGVVDLLLSKTAITDIAGNRIGLVGAMLDITERKRAEHDLKEALEFAEGIIAAIPDVLFEVNADGRYLQVWARNQEILAQRKEVLLGKLVRDVLPPDQADIAMLALEEADETGASYGRCVRIALPNGESRWFELSVARRPSSNHSTVTFLVLSRDITERKHAEGTTIEARARLLSVLQTIPDMVWLKDVTGKYLLCNHAFEELVGKAEAEIVGKTDYDLFTPELAQFFRDKDEEAMQAGRILINEERFTAHEDGRSTLLETRKVPVFTGGKLMGILGVARDITELDTSRKKIHQMAFYDSLTGLPNRTLFNERLREMIGDAASAGQRAGVMLIDMDHFKAINDTMGHPVGDELLRQVATRMKKGVRASDTVARLGGDEFAVLLPNVQDNDDLAQIASRMLAAFGERFMLSDREIFVSCSIGISVFPNDGDAPDDLVKYADSAMYLAKRSGRSNFRFYSKDLTIGAEKRLALESDLRLALKHEQLELHYQPKVLLDNGKVIGSEALLRWHHPKMGMIPPGEFIGVAEETGLIIDLGRWVLHEACCTAAVMNADGLPPHKIAINLSPKQFQCPRLSQTVADVLQETGCRAEWIEVEITESLLLHNCEGVSTTLSQLHASGISIAIDDFGTGYSSLSYLANFPIDTLKIDRSFINRSDKRSRELVKAILSIARCLGQNVVAEGVETVDQEKFLAESGCAVAQGFYYSKPIPKSELLAANAVPEFSRADSHLTPMPAEEGVALMRLPPASVGTRTA
ncbi:MULTISPECIES: sensor domain-containing protein [Rhizobium]|jgi:diguanylate cyclase (GGDEF)-like protein/PAS domain S-box-containing protein|uniref:GGDEF domain-containing protein n=2 Tax=Rhizobium TaxID=379 RepID=A0A2A5KKZ3_9HYPH|nr:MULTISPECIES: bifunctional diguanylate cyclase/phosphodiesterase [Rhizobium]ACE93865.1 probable two-component sensor histidine kinase protein [Rhizobium etli CIAT 652]UWU38939.1 EAL domain-containing protein [Rhizobium leguminosarum bv. phaseoli]ANM06925.1 GGDEF/EAL domain-containing protein [Rhizobium phaseoli]ARM91233.1 GGDEF/EAL domain-containing protein [Rhizobium sp. CIAT894]ARQ60677.1 GGDEF/EAL domain-containing protein [Rhizobium sp. Kim5]